MARAWSLIALPLVFGACSSDSSCESDCPGQTQCVMGTCRPPCASDDECASSEICSGVCIPGERPPLPAICDVPTVVSNDVLIDQDADQAPFQTGSCIIIRGDLEVIATDLQALSLPAVAAVQGKVRIAQNADLDSLYGVSGLRRIDGDLLIFDNHDLQSIILPSIESIGGRLDVRNNGALSESDCQQFLLRVQARGGSVCEPTLR